MIIKRRADERSGWGMGLGILVVGMALGSLLDPMRWVSDAMEVPLAASDSAPVDLAAFLIPNPASADAEENGLETIHIDFDLDAAATLQEVHDDALNRGMIIQTEADTVRGKVGFDSQSYAADLRIKGDWTDHVSTDKWSLRIKLDQGKLDGMRVFSIQHPDTRGMMWEWLVLRMARLEGLLAPRSSFVNVVLNGNPMGIYYLEEHFSKELLESQERREGPIVLWDESTRWASLLQAHNVSTKDVMLKVPVSSERVRSPGVASVRAYSEKRMGSIESLSRSMYSAVEQMRSLQAMDIAHSDRESQLRRMRALEDIQGKTIDTLLDTDKLAKMHALLALFQVDHALIWHNMRFYHDPLLDRLEPILFDCNAHHVSGRDLPIFRGKDMLYKEFGASETYYNGIFRHLAKLTAPGYLTSVLDEIGEPLRIYENALRGEFKLGSKYTLEAMLQRLRTQQVFLRTVIYPVDAVNFHAYHDIEASAQGSASSGSMSVECWSTTRTPVEVAGFEFSDGSFTSASDALLPGSAHTNQTPTGGVILPYDGTPLRLQFSANSRLVSLENIKQALGQTREASSKFEGLNVDVQVLFRPVAEQELRRESLSFRRRDPSWIEAGGRPQPPTMESALERHPFLELRPGSRELWVKPGTWNVLGDLVVPEGFALHALGVKLRFDSQSALVTSSALLFKSVILEPQVTQDRWRGVVVLQAKARSHWEEVKVRASDAVARGGWVLTGGVTFYRSPVTMFNCQFEGSWAEDGLNIFGADCLLDRVSFLGCSSDSFDGDFVSGALKNCRFMDGGADGVDVSGSELVLQACEFKGIADKAISVGEDSRVWVRGGRCSDVSIGVASKDRSEVIVEGMGIDGARNYALVAFIKKSEFGASSLRASNVNITNAGLGQALSQKGCELTLNGVLQAAQELDVKQLYREKILGQ